jgi:hypothetical protein
MPTDQKAVGSSPSERATSERAQVRSVLILRIRELRAADSNFDSNSGEQGPCGRTCHSVAIGVEKALQL